MYSAIVVLVLTVLVEVMLYAMARMGKGGYKVVYQGQVKNVRSTGYGANTKAYAHVKWPGMKWVDGKDEV